MKENLGFNRNKIEIPKSLFQGEDLSSIEKELLSLAKEKLDEISKEKIPFSKENINLYFEKVLSEYRKKKYLFEEFNENDFLKEIIFPIRNSFRFLEGDFTFSQIKFFIEKARERIDIPDPMEFTSIYSLEEIYSDLSEVKKLKKKWFEGKKKKKTELYSELFEYAMVEALETWLNVSPIKEYQLLVYKTSEPDDFGITNPRFYKGFDFTIEVQDLQKDENSYFGATIDVTSTEDVGVVRKKISSIIQMIKKNEVPQIKYFKNAKEEPVGSVFAAPFVLVVGKENSRDILKIFSRRLMNFQNNSSFEQHRVQYSVIRQLIDQSHFYLVLAKKYQADTFIHFYENFLDYLNYLNSKKDKSFVQGIDIENLSEHFEGRKILSDVMSEYLKEELRKRRRVLRRKK